MNPRDIAGELKKKKKRKKKKEMCLQRTDKMCTQENLFCPELLLEVGDGGGGGVLFCFINPISLPDQYASVYRSAIALLTPLLLLFLMPQHQLHSRYRHEYIINSYLFVLRCKRLPAGSQLDDHPGQHSLCAAHTDHKASSIKKMKNKQEKKRN